MSVSSNIYSNFRNTNSYYRYLISCVRRFLVESNMLFIFQYASIFFIPHGLEPAPFNMSVGIAFVLFYLRGARMIVAISLGCFLSYYMSNYAILWSITNTLVDVLTAILVASYSHRIICSDLSPFENKRIFLKFFMLSFILSTIGGLLKAAFAVMFSGVSFKAYPYLLINYCVANANGILIIGGYILSLVFVPYSVHLFRDKIKFTPAILLSLILIIFNYKLVGSVEGVASLAASAIVCFYVLLRHDFVVSVTLFTTLCIQSLSHMYVSNVSGYEKMDYVISPLAFTALILFVYLSRKRDEVEC